MDDKEVLKEALKEWLDEKFAAFGRWSFTTIAILGLSALAYFILTINGWHRP
jgi:hypothetical protein